MEQIKHLLITSILFCLPLGLLAQPQIKFENQTINFGSVTEGEAVEVEFVYTNIGSENFMITNCLTGCGCISCIPSRKPLPPGHSDTLLLYIDTYNRAGAFTRAVVLQTNAPAPNNNVRLEISGFIRKK